MGAHSITPSLRHSVTSSWPLLLFAVAALVPLSPFASPLLVAHGEVWTVHSGVVEAKSALREGQFPLRVLPFQNGRSRYPLFQFYGNAPFTAAGLVSLVPGVGTYTALKLTLLAALAGGGYFVYRLAFWLTGRRGPAVWAGLVFLTAPYLFTDLSARGALAESFALCLLPAALYASTRCLASPRRRFLVGTAVAWTLLGLTHNITYLYGILFAGLFLLAHLRPRRRFARRVRRLLAAGSIHALLMLWYVVPHFAVMRDLPLSQELPSPQQYAFLTRLPVLLSPVLRVPEGSTTPRLGPQVGWPILAGVAGAAVVFLLPRASRRLRRSIGLLLALFALAFLLAWSPVDVWAYLPRTLHYVQFPYRLLGFVMLWGSLLAACALAGIKTVGSGEWGVGSRGGRPTPHAPHPTPHSLRPTPHIPARASAALAAALAASCVSYLHRPRTVLPVSMRDVARAPTMGGRTDYLLATPVLNRTSLTHPDMDLAGWEFGLTADPDGYIGVREAAEVPVPAGAAGLRVEGTVVDAVGRDIAVRPPATQPTVTLTVVAAGSRDDWALPPGPFVRHLATPTAAGRRTTLVELGADPATLPPPHPEISPLGPPTLRLTRLTWEGPGGAPLPADMPLVTKANARQKVRYGDESKWIVKLDRPAVVQVPVLYYPGLLQVTDNRRPVAYGNMGRFVALDLPAGNHSLAVRFVGVRWANLASVAGVVLLALAAVPSPRRMVARFRAMRSADAR